MHRLQCERINKDPFENVAREDRRKRMESYPRPDENALVWAAEINTTMLVRLHKKYFAMFSSK